MKNNNHKKGILALDIDGTLLTDSGKITPEVHSSLMKASLNGWEIVLATGRTYYAARSVLDELPLAKYAVSSNGACIVDSSLVTALRIEKIDPAICSVVISAMRTEGAIPTIYNSLFENQSVYYDTLKGASPYFTWYVTEDKRCRMVEDVLFYAGDVLQIGTIAEKEKVLSIKEKLEDADICVLALPFESSSFGGKLDHHWFLQVVNRNSTKYNALVYLSSVLGISPDRIVAVGDNYNDAEMIKESRVGVAMGNSPDEIKKLARVVVGSNNDSGISQVVEEVLLGNEFFPELD